jgi:hypothetical protein
VLALMFPRKPKLDEATRKAVDLYSTDDLRRLYQLESTDLIRLRDSNLKRADLRAEILWRLWCERWVSRITLFFAVVGAMAAIVAAVEGWPQ